MDRYNQLWKDYQPNNGSVGPSFPGPLRQEPWAVPLVAASATNAAAILAFEAYIVARALRGTPSRRHLFLGQCLMLGLLLCSVVGLPLAAVPSQWTCACVRLLLSIAPCIVFGTLLVKTVFLISLNAGVYLPAYYQGLLLFFIVLVQVAISTQWLAVMPAAVVTLVAGDVPSRYELVAGDVTSRYGDVTSRYELCAAPYRHTLLSLMYVMALMLAVAALAVKCRGLRENYRESSYIGACMLICIPLWGCWAVAGTLVPLAVQPACLGFGATATSTVVFILMFLPKGRQLAAAGADGLYREDREEGISSAARYSPSFFLFKPLKPGKDDSTASPSFYKSPLTGTTNSNGLSSVNSSESLYASLRQPSPHFLPSSSPHFVPSSHPNFYLFRSHAHTGMFY